MEPCSLARANVVVHMIRWKAKHSCSMFEMKCLLFPSRLRGLPMIRHNVWLDHWQWCEHVLAHTNHASNWQLVTRLLMFAWARSWSLQWNPCSHPPFVYLSIKQGANQTSKFSAQSHIGRASKPTTGWWLNQMHSLFVSCHFDHFGHGWFSHQANRSKIPINSGFPYSQSTPLTCCLL